MNKTVLKLAVPSILANITVPLVGMADTAIAGRIGDASVLGGVAIASMLFDLLYWNMGFLRMGTGGMVAQAYGRRDFRDAMNVYALGMATAFAFAFLFLVLQYLYVEVAFRFIECSPQVEALAREYFFIRIWAAPATLSLNVFKGFFIGMQNAVSPMAVDVTVNITNVAASIFFAFYAGMGFSGIAWGTLVAQYAGMALAATLMILHYRKLFHYIDIKGSVKFSKMKKFFMLNADLFVRSLSFLFIYAGLTSLSAGYGDVALAVSSIMMKLMLLYSYFIDGFAYAGEALSGRYIGAGDKVSLRRAVRVIFIWCIGIGIVSTFGYWVGGEWLFAFLASDPVVIEESAKYIPWLLVMPLVSCVAFTWDGIYIGATATRAIRNSMLCAVAGFFASYWLLGGMWGVQSLWVGYMVHLVVRSVYLTATARKEVFEA
ncbi:MAG: MATE family efflux transporter [Bacteroidales bacterium]|nr:MATE family efflux transporter [Bacteroidales bacterium]MBQ7018201.1 MATE family efflux transporter [Bacteroidales bacterium]